MKEITKKFTLRQNLKSILPLQLIDDKRYQETDLQIIARGLQNPISNIVSLEIVSTIIAELSSVIIVYGIPVNQNSAEDSLVSVECAKLIMAYYSHISIEQIRHAFRISHLTGADLESYGKRFNAAYLKKVMDAYCHYIDVVIPSIKNAEKIAANRQKSIERAKREQAARVKRNQLDKLKYYVTVAKGLVTAYVYFQAGRLDLEQVSNNWIKILEEDELVTDVLTPAIRKEIQQEATAWFKRKAASQLANATPTERHSLVKLNKSLLQNVIPKDSKSALEVLSCKVAVKFYFQHIAFEVNPEDFARILYARFSGNKRITKQVWLDNFDVKQHLKELAIKIEEAQSLEAAKAQLLKEQEAFEREQQEKIVA